jgi:hypothetical protein
MSAVIMDPPDAELCSIGAARAGDNSERHGELLDGTWPVVLRRLRNNCNFEKRISIRNMVIGTLE